MQYSKLEFQPSRLWSKGSSDVWALDWPFPGTRLTSDQPWAQKAITFIGGYSCAFSCVEKIMCMSAIVYDSICTTLLTAAWNCGVAAREERLSPNDYFWHILGVNPAWGKNWREHSLCPGLPRVMRKPFTTLQPRSGFVKQPSIDSLHLFSHLRDRSHHTDPQQSKTGRSLAQESERQRQMSIHAAATHIEELAASHAHEIESRPHPQALICTPTSADTCNGVIEVWASCQWSTRHIYLDLCDIC